MEKFYIVTNPEFLANIKAYKENVRRQNEFIKEFYAKKDIQALDTLSTEPEV